MDAFVKSRNVTIEHAQPSDMPTVAMLTAELSRQEGRVYDPGGELRGLDWLQRAKGGKVWVARDGGWILGSISVWVCDGDAIIAGLICKPQAPYKTALRLMDAAVTEIEKCGMKTIGSILITDKNKSRATYAGLGFTVNLFRMSGAVGGHVVVEAKTKTVRAQLDRRLKSGRHH